MVVAVDRRDVVIAETAIVLFLSGALIAGPWFVTQMLADARRDEDARPDNG